MQIFFKGYIKLQNNQLFYQKLLAKIKIRQVEYEQATSVQSNVANYPPGIYVFEIKSGGRTYYRKVIVV